MAYEFTREDVEFLRSPRGAEELALVDQMPLTEQTLVRDITSARERHGDRAAALIETIRLRRRARIKLAADRPWLLTADALEQATPLLVARHRAQRLHGRDIHDVTCSIGADLAVLAEHGRSVIGSDIDPVRASMAAHNAPAALVIRADALVPSSRGTVVVADPARRADGRRTHDPSKLVPPLPDLLTAYADRDLVVKCAPGIDYDALGWPGEVEVVSLDGGVRETALWSRGLTDGGTTRRATILRSDGARDMLTDAEPDDIPERPEGQWIIDPDGAIVRSGLVRHYAAREGLWQLDPRIAYLTGDHRPAGARGHRILERAPFREKPLRALLRRLDCGSLEILARGVRIDPDALRRRLKPSGTRSLSLVIVRIGDSSEAFVCEPVAPTTATASPGAAPPSPS
ncbi:class I SAM-dependent methyltransferase [Lolliginicoccus levis]|uniref:class I SAM-dependent methyltransferase n=1 Tax=Lolliginicoccus levis TaxID=2919542 RepID=UPI00241F8315|nr:class I SAM-dependent methyltransferase [Lolliginicoccus levis]